MAGIDTPSAAWGRVPTLHGRHATLEPLAAGHADGLRAALGDGALSQLWYANVPAPAAVDEYIAKALAAREAGTALPFVVRDRAGAIAGSTRFYDLQPSVPSLKIGYTWYAPQVQRSGVNSEAKLLLLGHAFETLECASVSFETSWFNHASRAAIARLGAKQDGVLRAHKRHADGSLRDTVVFSILAAEWPAAKRHLQFRLESHS
ncbi:GNAT family N-acetyltransferase [Stenotrophomonas sp. MMGLT7]|uniref:GNAT family N-acetyltransferase n=1 Tax=Stenotrophomonas sp. MMGLT7 TaxID=2901227 RepID=UPI001E5CD5A5|nr:GNAT family N-acetyltransferase [Stenotrophomonas sp. MMGLT7]MCD7097319.1 GNAT family N-acetyltransferase [Stenotrophomonas sp. MMGLT7]